MNLFVDIPEQIASDPWFKIVDMLQHNWAVLLNQDESTLAVFYGDDRGVFDQIAFDDTQLAETALRRNGFAKYIHDPKAQKFISLPEGKFRERLHPNGFIYSSGRFWH
jgi:hypothetical protein